MQLGGACANLLGEINCNYSKSDRINLIKITTWILLYTVQDTSISGACALYTDTNISEKAGCKSEVLSKVE